MSLPIPTVGTASGPDWATLLNACLTVLDSHSHVAGSGVPITPAAININADLPMRGYSLTLSRSINFSAQATALAQATDVGCLYQVNDDLYYNDASGTQIRLTQAGSIVGTSGSISGMSGAASASYSSGVFVWRSGINTAADMDVGSVTLRNSSPNSTYGLTLSPPSGLAANYAITLPALPAASSVMLISSSGVVTASAAATASLNPAGVILQFGGSVAPSGYLVCDGASYLRSTYSDLFAVIGTAYGSADATHFNVPDLRGKFARGQVNFTASGSGSVASNNATFSGHGVNRTGFKVRKTSGTLSGLSASTTYYAIVIDANTLAFAATLANALAGTKIAISGTNSAVLGQWEDPNASSRTQSTVGSGTTAGLGSAQESMLGVHGHGVTDPGHNHTSTTASAKNGSSPGGAFTGFWNQGDAATATGSSATGVTVNATGDNETAPANVYVNHIIKY